MQLTRIKADLSGRVAIVTGASQGIGAAIAARLSEAGCTVAGVSRNLVESQRRDTLALALRADLAMPGECEQVVSEVTRVLGVVDLLVNNAAAAVITPLFSCTLEAWRTTWAINLEAPWNLTRLVVDGMRRRGGGHVINISSSAARGPGPAPYSKRPEFPPLGAYGVQKAALERMSAELAHELWDDGIAVTWLYPAHLVETTGTARLGLTSSCTEPAAHLAEACLLLATMEPAQNSGRGFNSHSLLSAHGLLSR